MKSDKLSGGSSFFSLSSHLTMAFLLLQSNTHIIYISTSQSVLAASDASLKNADPLSIQLAGPALYFLLIDLFLYWGLLAFIEYGYLRALINKCRRQNRQNELLKARTNSASFKDNDVDAEESRVK